jgi:hypothetical protein
MASIKDLKKDVNYLASAVLSDTYTYSLVCTDENVEKVAELMANAIRIQEDLLTRINVARRADKKELKAKMQEIRKDMFTQVDEAFSNLSALVKEK